MLKRPTGGGHAWPLCLCCPFYSSAQRSNVVHGYKRSTAFGNQKNVHNIVCVTLSRQLDNWKSTVRPVSDFAFLNWSDNTWSQRKYTVKKRTGQPLSNSNMLFFLVYIDKVQGTHMNLWPFDPLNPPFLNQYWYGTVILMIPFLPRRNITRRKFHKVWQRINKIHFKTFLKWRENV